MPMMQKSRRSRRIRRPGLDTFDDAQAIALPMSAIRTV